MWNVCLVFTWAFQTSRSNYFLEHWLFREYKAFLRSSWTKQDLAVSCTNTLQANVLGTSFSIFAREGVWLLVIIQQQPSIPSGVVTIHQPPGHVVSYVERMFSFYLSVSKFPRISSVGYPQIYTGGSYPLFLPYRGFLWVLWPQFHNTLYFCEFCDSCTTIPYTSVLWQLHHNTLYFCESCDSCTTIAYTSVSSVTHQVPTEITLRDLYTVPYTSVSSVTVGPQYPALLWVL